MNDDRRNPGGKPPPGADPHEPFDDEFDEDFGFDGEPHDDDDDHHEDGEWDEPADNDFSAEEPAPAAPPPPAPAPASPPRARPARKRTEIDPDLIAPTPTASQERAASSIAPSPPPEAATPGGGKLHWQVDDPEDVEGDADERTLRKGDMILPPNYEIIRFIDAGGMGEVYEAKNVQTYERLAIKVILPEWAQKTNVIQQFRDEARILVQLKDDALVPYVQFFYDPALELHGLMMGFVDGDNLADILDTLNPSPAELRTLIKRLASGLKVAHKAGAVHRDLSPDNVILRNRKIEEAVIIDFGIAKDIKGSEGQGDKGFSGKLDYASPEQLGMFGGVMGTASDVYSLGLLILAVARGEDMELGATRMDAVHRREDGIDTSAAPADLRPILDDMLALDPVDRLGTMDAVLAALAKLDEPEIGGRSGGDTGPKGGKGGGSGGLGISPVVAGGAGVGVLLLAALAVWLMQPSSSQDDPDTPIAQGSDDGAQTETAPQPATMADPVGEARAALATAYPSIGCSWLDEVSITGSQEQIGVTLSGVAGDPARVLGDVTRTLEGAGFAGRDVNLDGVARIGREICPVLDAYRQVRADGTNRIRLPQTDFEITPTESRGLSAQFVISLDGVDSVQDYALFSSSPDGKIAQELPSKSFLAERVNNKSIVKSASGYQVRWFASGEGWHGFALVTGQGPFDADLIAPPDGQRDAAWAARFVQTAKERDWKVEMNWYNLVDREPN
ncbi:MAG: serine/threonine-protein kinase [Pseudomonadota bacterium]